MGPASGAVHTARACRRRGGGGLNLLAGAAIVTTAADARRGKCFQLPSGTAIDATAAAVTAAVTVTITDAADDTAAIAAASPYRATHQLGNYLSDPRDDDKPQLGWTQAQSRSHGRGLFSMLAADNDIAQAFLVQRPPSQPLAILPTCPASDLSAPTLFADANATEFRHTWHEAMAK